MNEWFAGVSVVEVGEGSGGLDRRVLGYRAALRGARWEMKKLKIIICLKQI